MNFKRTECNRLGFKYKYVFENVLYALHHLPYAKEYINEEALKLLEELNLKINIGEIEIIEFTRPVYKYLDVDEIVKENKELNNIINELEKYIIDRSSTSWDDNGAYDDVLDKIKELKENNNAKD